MQQAFQMEYPSILDSLNSKNNTNTFLSVSERYYEHKYCMTVNSEITNVNQRVSFHSNRICLISLADNHPVIKNHKRIKRINCAVDDNTDRLKNAASGKGKRGAQKLSPESILCYIECEDTTVYPVYSCIKGKLVEINENLVENPNLLVEKPTEEGFIALVLPFLNTFNAFKDSMLSKEQYLCD